MTYDAHVTQTIPIKSQEKTMFRNSTMQRIIASTLLASFASAAVAPVVAFAQNSAPFTLQPLNSAPGRGLPGVDANGIPTGKGWQRHAAPATGTAVSAPTQVYGHALSQLEALALKSDADLAAGRGSDALAKVNAVRAQFERMKKEEAVMAQSFAATEAHLRAKGLASGEILARHQQAVQDFAARNAELKAAMAVLDAAAGGSGSLQSALNQLAKLLKQHSSLTGQGAQGKGHAWGKRKKATAAVALTERAHEKRFPRSVQLAAAGSLSGIALPDAILPEAVQPGDLAEQGEVVLSPAVRALAAQLGNNPVAIYNWVRNNIAYAPGFGATQDADAVLLARRGSATDTATLLVALNRAAGIPARYVYGTIEVPAARLRNWLGVDSVAAAQALLSQAGIPHRAVTQAGQPGALQLEHVWVQAHVDFSPSRGAVNKAPGTWVPLDASFKQMDSMPGLDLSSAVSLNETGLLSQARQDAVCTPDYAQNLNLANLQAGYTDYKTRLNTYLGQQGSDLTVGDVLGKRSIAAQNYSILLGTLPYTQVAQGAVLNVLPDALRWQFRLQLFAGAAQQATGNAAVSYSGSLAAVANKRLTLSFVPATPADAEVLASYLPKPHADGSPIQPGELPLEVPGYLVRVTAEIRADGELVASGGSFVLGSELAGEIASFDPSSGSWNDNPFAAHAGDYHAVAIDAQGVATGQLAAVNARLNALQAKLASNQTAGLSRDDVSGELLYHAALSYFATVDANAGVFQRAARVVEQRLPSYGRAVAQAQPEMVLGIVNKVRFPGVVLDIDRLDSAVAQNSGGLAPAAYLTQANERNAAYSHLVLAKLFTSTQVPGQAASPLKALQAAAGAGSKIYAVTGANAAAVLPLVDIGSDAADDIRNAAAAGSRALVAQAPVNIGNWNGHGLVMEDSAGAGSYRLHGESGYATAALYLPNGTTWLALASPAQAAAAAAPAASAAMPVNDTLASLLGEAGSTTRWSYYAGQADVASGLFLARLAAGQGSTACDTLTGVIAAGLDTSGGFDGGAVAGAPVITSAPVISGGANQLYHYAVLASDPKGAALAYTLREAPSGMTISATGVINWGKPVAGSWTVAVRADNGRAYAEQRYQLTVGQQAPLEAKLVISPQVINLGESVTIDVVSSGGSGAVNRSLNIDGQDVALTVEGRAIVTGAAVGAHQITATVTDSAGSTTRVGTYSVRDPADSTTPVAQISAPVDDAEVTAPVNVTGTASATNLAYYQLLLRAAGAANWNEIARGTSSVSNGVLGKLDPTQLANGIYEMVLNVVDANGRQQTQMITVDVLRDLKVGQFALTFVDLNVEASGIPIRVTRTYDTRKRTRKMDFGYGWNVDYQGSQIQKNMVLGLQWNVVSHATNLTLCLVPAGKRKINIVLPDGKVERFTAANRQECAFVQVPDVDIKITPLPGTTSKLEIINIPNVMARGGMLYDMDNLEPWNPREFKLTTEDGYVYYLTEGVGIVQIKDPSGNTLTYGQNGILHSNGQSVSFTRDGQGRITAVTDPTGRAIKYAYDAAGDLTSVTNRVNAVSRYSYAGEHFLTEYTDAAGTLQGRMVYDADGRLSAAYDADGKAIEFTHEVDSRRQTMKDRLGNVTTFVYDDAGNVVERINAYGQKTTYTYDAQGNETSVTDAKGNVLKREFDARSGKILSESDALGNKSTYQYDDVGSIMTSSEDARGNKTTYDYSKTVAWITEPLGKVTRAVNDAKGNLTTITSAGITVTNEFDAKGNRIKETDALGNVTTYTYDANNRLTGRSWSRVLKQGGDPVPESISNKLDGEGRAIETTGPTGVTVKAEYNGGGQVTARVDGLGRRTTYEYNARGKLVRTNYPDGTSESVTFDAESNKTASTDRHGRTTRFAYDALNRLTKTSFPDGTSSTLEYDAVGRVSAAVDANGNREEYAYDAAGRMLSSKDALGRTTQFAYDAVGNRTAVTDPDGRVTKYEYDALNRLTKTIMPDGKATSVVWNLDNTKQSETDASGNVTSFAYDAAGRLAQVKQFSNDGELLTTFAFDSVGNKVSQTDAEGRVTRWEYDGLSRVTARTLPGGETERFAYDAVGSQIGHTDFSGKQHATAFDTAERPALQVRADGTRVAKSFTPNGLVASVTVTPGTNAGVLAGTTSFEYDVQDRVTRQTNPDGSFIAYAYDAKGNVTQRTTKAGSSAYSYDDHDRLLSVQDAAGGKTSYEYDASGRLVKTTLPNKLVATPTYDENGRLLQVLHQRPDGNIVSGVSYTLAPDGKRTGLAEFDSQSVAVQGAATNPARSSSFTYDKAGRLTREVATARGGAPLRTVDYEYDKVGNRVRKVEVTAAGTESTTYRYDGNDRLLEARKQTATGSVVLTAYGWDANGNLASKAVGSNSQYFFWNSANQLVEVRQGATRESAVAIARYTYDADGNRVQRTVPGQSGQPDAVTRYLVDPSFGIAQTLEETLVAGDATSSQRYVWGRGLIELVRGGQATIYHSDGLDSAKALTDGDGKVVAEYAYDAFGNVDTQAESRLNAHLYTGEYFDETIGLQYNRARWYDAATGRFVSQDTHPGNKEAPLSLNKYIYGEANPVSNIDPTGLFSLSETMSAIEGQASLAARAFANYGRQVGGNAVRKLGQMVESAVENVLTRCLGKVPKRGPRLSGPSGNAELDFLVELGQKTHILEVKYQISPKAGPAFDRLVKQLKVAMENGHKPNLFVFKDSGAQKRLLKQLGDKAGDLTIISGFAELGLFLGQFAIENCIGI
jgi:RHS repeat-associated protein